jgi:hypothetical protein
MSREISNRDAKTEKFTKNASHSALRKFGKRTIGINV